MTKQDSNIAKEQTNTQRKGSKGFLVWGAIVILNAILPLFSEPLPPGPGIRAGDFSGSKIIATSSPSLKLLSIFGALISFGICFLFYRLSQTREKRFWLPRLLGLLFFVLASLYPYFGLSAFAEAEVMEAKGLGSTLGGMEHARFTAGLFLALGLAFLVISYFLLFKSGRQSKQKSIQEKCG